MLSTPLICCSIGVATDCSTVCASAPTYVVCTWTSGGAMLGNNETGSVARVIAPTMTVTIEITMAMMGRLMKNFDTWSDPGFRGTHLYRLGIDGNPITDLRETLDHDVLAWLYALHDPH